MFKVLIFFALLAACAVMVGVAGERSPFLPRDWIPHSNRTVGAAGGERAAVGREVQRVNR